MAKDGADSKEKSMAKVIRFINNYPSNWAQKAFADDKHLADHIQSKWEGYAKSKASSYEAILRIMTELDLENEKKLMKYIDATFEKGGRTGDKKWIQKALGGHKGTLKKKALQEGLIRNMDENLSETDLKKLERMSPHRAKQVNLARTLKTFGAGGKAGDDYLYFYAKDERPYVLFKTKNITGFIPDAEDRARTVARENKMELAGGMTSSPPHGMDDPEQYRVINVPDKTKPTDKDGNILPPPLSEKQKKKMKAEQAKTKGKGKVKSKTIKVFSFEDLSDDAQEKALEKNRYMNVEDDWWEFMYEDAENIGLKITGFDLDRGKHADGEFINSAKDVANSIIENHGDQTETYKTAKSYLTDLKAIEDKYTDKEDDSDMDDDIENLNEEFLKSLLEDYAQMLQDEYDYKMSDEAVKEMIMANDYEFMEDGSPAEFAKGGEAGSKKTSGICWIITGYSI